jgi:hypothetical protein
MITKTSISYQDAYELNKFVHNLEARRITTPELKSVLMLLRQYSKSTVLIEWADSVAHRKRIKGDTFAKGTGLWLERFELYAYFSTHPNLKRIPVPIFDLILNVVADPKFDLGECFRVDMSAIYPDGYTRQEIVDSLKFMYRPKHSLFSDGGFNLFRPSLIEFRLVSKRKRKLGCA